VDLCSALVGGVVVHEKQNKNLMLLITAFSTLVTAFII